MSSLHGPEEREDKNEESAEHSTMDAECEDVVEDSLDEIDEEGMTQRVLKLVRVFYHVLWQLQQGFGSTLPVSILLTPILAPKPLALTLDLA